MRGEGAKECDRSEFVASPGKNVDALMHKQGERTGVNLNRDTFGDVVLNDVLGQVEPKGGLAWVHRDSHPLYAVVSRIETHRDFCHD